MNRLQVVAALGVCELPRCLQLVERHTAAGGDLGLVGWPYDEQWRAGPDSRPCVAIAHTSAAPRFISSSAAATIVPAGSITSSHSKCEAALTKASSS